MGMRLSLAQRRKIITNMRPGLPLQRETKRNVKRGTGKHSRKKQSSLLEERFANRWKNFSGWVPDRQYEFHPSRKWKFDFAFPAARVAVEVHGAIWTGGRHTTGEGFWGDRIKINAATAMGWAVFELVPEDLEDDEVFKVISDEIARRWALPLSKSTIAPFARKYAEGKRKKAKRELRELKKRAA